MKRFIAVALLASLSILALTDTAEARRCRRRACCQTACCQVQNACMPQQQAFVQDPQAMNQYGQPQYGQPTPATTFYRGDASGQQQPLPPAPQQFNSQGSAQGSVNTRSGSIQGSVDTNTNQQN